MSVVSTGEFLLSYSPVFGILSIGWGLDEAAVFFQSET